MRKAIQSLGLAVVAGVLCLAQSAQGIETERVADDLNRPIFVTAPEGDYERLFIMEQRGVIKILNLLTGVVNTTSFLNIDSSVTGPTSAFDERGMLGLAFHPDYMENGYFFVHYNSGDDTVISRFSVSATDADEADEDSEVILLEISQPFSNHKGGTIAFSPIDGYLYLGFGDGGSGEDPFDNGQSEDVLLGKMLRIDVNDFASDAYAIPADNPFVDVGDPLDEIWAIGMRNPYRWSFDRETGDLYIGDVGQYFVEEIDFQPASSTGGENYGWSCHEGDTCPSYDGCSCATADFDDPIWTYTHVLGRCSITGGYVYRGTAIDGLQGTYFYADWCSAEIWSFVYDGVDVTDDMERTTELAPGAGMSIVNIAGFGEDAYGEMYIVDRAGTSSGEIYKIVPDNLVDLDCNENNIVDSAEIAVGVADDCDGDGVIDTCQIDDGTATDCNANGTLDSCDLAGGVGSDCDANGSFDACELAGDPALDCDDNGVLDTCDLTGGAPDCDQNGVIDSCDIAGGGVDLDLNGVLDLCELPPMIRGDANGDGVLGLPDALYGLAYLFSNGPVTCRDALDINDSGNVDISDSIGLLGFLFISGPAPPPPYPDCGVDLTGDAAGNLGCETFTSCP